MEHTDLSLIKIPGDLLDIAQHPDNYPEEAVCMCLDTLKNIRSKLYEKVVIVEQNLINRMIADGSTKIGFKDVSGETKIGTLKSGTVSCTKKDIDLEYKRYGFQPLEIGEYIFKPSWSKAKEARKYGGLKKEIIDKYFIEGKKGVTIK